MVDVADERHAAGIGRDAVDSLSARPRRHDRHGRRVDVRRRTRGGTLVRIVHVWNGPSWPLIGDMAARGVIGPVFVHGIASRTLAGLARAAERSATDASRIEVSSG